MKRITYLVTTHTVDFDRGRRYLRDIEALAAEGRRSQDPQVLLTALRVLALQAQTAVAAWSGGRPVSAASNPIAAAIADPAGLADEWKQLPKRKGLPAFYVYGCGLSEG